VPPSCRLISRVVPVLVPWAGPAAQALSRSCLVPALALWCRARSVLGPCPCWLIGPGPFGHLYSLLCAARLHGTRIHQRRKLGDLLNRKPLRRSRAIECTRTCRDGRRRSRSRQYNTPYLPDAPTLRGRWARRPHQNGKQKGRR
jgi:hypothetical protein